MYFLGWNLLTKLLGTNSSERGDNVTIYQLTRQTRQTPVYQRQVLVYQRHVSVYQMSPDVYHHDNRTLTDGSPRWTHTIMEDMRKCHDDANGVKLANHGMLRRGDMRQHGQQPWNELWLRWNPWAYDHGIWWCRDRKELTGWNAAEHHEDGHDGVESWGT